MGLNPKWKTGNFNNFEPEELYKILQLRMDVFVVEQNRSVAEIDGKDLNAEMIHIAAFNKGSVIGYLRISPPGLSYSEVSIERVVVSSTYRGKGLAKELMHKAIHQIKSTYPGQSVKIHAQQYLENFYCSFGFKRSGEPFDEDGIPHVFLVSNKEF